MRVVAAWRHTYLYQMTDIRPGTIERAFQIARDSQFTTIDQIRRKLKEEGYGDWQEQLSGSAIRGQLRKVISERAEVQTPGATSTP